MPVEEFAEAQREAEQTIRWSSRLEERNQSPRAVADKIFGEFTG